MKDFHGYEVKDMTFLTIDEGVYTFQPLVVDVNGVDVSIWELGLPRGFRVDLPSGEVRHIDRMNIGKFLKCVELEVEIAKDGFDYEVEYNPYLYEYNFDTGSSLYSYYKDNLWHRNGGEDARTMKEWLEQGEEEAPSEAWGYPVVRTEARAFNNYKIDVIVVNVAGIDVRVEEYSDCYSVDPVSSDTVIKDMFSGFFSEDRIGDLLKQLELTMVIRKRGFEETVQFDVAGKYYWFTDSRTFITYIYANDGQWCRESEQGSRLISYAQARPLEYWAEKNAKMFKLVTSFEPPKPKDSGTWFEEGGLKITTVQVGDKRGVVIVTDEKTVLVVDGETMLFDSLGELSDWLDDKDEYEEDQ